MTPIDRRQLLLGSLTAAGLAAATTVGLRRYLANQMPPPAPIQYAEHEILMLIYPRFTILDLIGPQHVFSLLGPEFRSRLVWKDREEMVSDTGVPVRPTMTFDECRDKPTVLFIPGGTDGTLAAMEDPVVRQFVADMGQQATYVTSVCTGSLILGAAGLLDGYQATTHWLAMSVLDKFGAIPVRDRVVVDRNRITGGGVTTGIDFGLKLAAILKDEDYARSVQLMMEYDPQPPFATAGTPAGSSKETVGLLEAMADPFLREVEAAIGRIATSRMH